MKLVNEIGMRKWQIVGIFLLLSLLVSCYDGYQSPPENRTSTNMYVLKRRILRYAQAHNSLPHSLEDLPPVDDFENAITDAWGNEIQYGTDGTTVTLTSYGKDQKPGGTGDDLDVIGVFEPRTPDGNWRSEKNSDNYSDWKIAPLRDKK